MLCTQHRWADSSIVDDAVRRKMAESCSFAGSIKIAVANGQCHLVS